jgi:predicted O-methyltransferase YrrM
VLDLIIRLAASKIDISAHLTTLYSLALRCSSPSIAVVELGVRRGASTLAMLAACKKTCGRLVSYDIDPECPSNVRLTSTINAGNKWDDWERSLTNNWDFRCKDSIEAAADWPGPHPLERSVGMLFIDTDHHYDRTRDELDAWLPKLRDDAVICGHDYISDENGVSRAVNEFSDAYSKRFELVALPNDWGLFVLLPK